MSNKTEVFIKNKQAYSAVVNVLKALKDAGAIIGRTDSAILLRPLRIPSVLFEELLGNDIKLYQAGYDSGFITVFADFKYNERAAIINISLVTQPLPFACLASSKLVENDEFPSISDIRAKLLAIAVLGDEHLGELELLTASPDELVERWHHKEMADGFESLCSIEA